MSTALAIPQQSGEISMYNNIENPLEFIEKMGAAFSKSGMFGTTNEQQGQVLAMACIAERKNPIELIRVYHLIQGKLSMRADAMLAEFRKAGGKYTWLKDGSDGQEASARFVFEENDREVSYTLDEALKAKLVKKDGGWEKNPAEMLRARVVSRAIKMLCPEVCSGYYTPEEIEDMGIADSKMIEPAKPATKSAEEVAALMKRASERGKAAVAANPEGPAAKKEPVVLDEPKREAGTEPTYATPEFASKEQLSEIKTLLESLGVTPEDQAKVCRKRGVETFRSFKFEQAAELLGKLREKWLGLDKANAERDARLAAECEPKN